jgi:prepilin-type N-terminal cleavage/methylation domain-containing protein
MFLRQESGFSLIETIVALGILSIISMAFLSGLATNFTGKAVQRKAAFGEAIATSQIEYVKKQPFSTNEWSYNVSTTSRSSTQQPTWWDDDNPPLLHSDYTGYYVVISAEDFDADGDSTIEVPGDDDSVRNITADVYNNQDDFMFTLSAYKTNR